MLTVLLAWLLADFMSGIIHWAEDKMLNTPQRFKFLEAVRKDNDLHHLHPTAMTRWSLWENINTTAVITIPLTLLLLLIGAPMILWLGVFFATFANIVHRFAHLPRHKVGWVFRYLQYVGLFLSLDHHARHHWDESGLIPKKETTQRYCPMTNWLNPILDRLQFFRFLEYLFVKQ